MIFNLTTRRNSVHLAWLLLLVPPLARSVVDWSNDNPTEFVVDSFRVLGALAVVLLLLWLRSHPVSGRSVRLLKDLRTLMPGALVAVLFPGVLAVNGNLTRFPHELSSIPLDHNVNSPNVAALLQAGAIHQSAGRIPEAEAAYRQVLSIHPAHSQALYLRKVVAVRPKHRAGFSIF